jgi:chromosome segregation protein
MRVEKIELIGFKSFSERTVFNLHPGITCIVGPNGCGKSNIVDSFKWVLGEQSAKSLRGEKMEEVIFSGSQTKKPKGMAEVTLFVSGLNGSEDGKDSITTVTRRLYRSGDSDYMINRTPCRLRDIRDIFLDTGLELKSYSILEQDRIAAILSAKPEERRFLIEEVAGVVKYKVRRSEAQSKLDSSRLNLQRVNDIIAEVKRQMNYLDRQVKKAERYKKLMAELRTIELKIAKREYTSLSKALEEVLSQYASLKEEDALQRAELTQIENQLETRRIGLVEKEKHLDALQQSLQGTEKDIAELERSIAVSRTERDNLKEYAVKLQLQDEENKNKIKTAGERKQEIEAQLRDLQVEIDALKAEMFEKTESLTASEEEISQKEQLLESKRKDAFRVSETLSHFKNERHRYLASLDSLKRKEEGIHKESSDLKDYLNKIESSAREMESLLLSKKNDILILSEEKRLLEGEIAEYRQRLDTLRADVARVREELASASSRLESLKEMVSAESTELEDLRVIASISDVIEVPEQYEKAIESALREVINGFILPAYEDVKQAVNTLKAKGAGRTAFIPLNNTNSRGGESTLPEGAIAWAADLVKVNGEFSSIIRNLLNDVVVVNDLETALNITKPHYVSVTLDGETVEPSGAVIAGKSKGILTLKRQIRELTTEIEAKRAKVESIQKEIDESLASLKEKENSLEQTTAKSIETEKELSLLKLKVEKHAEDKDRTNKKLAYLKLEEEEIQRERDSLNSLLSEKDTEISRLEEEKRLIEAAISEIQEEISGKKAAYEQKRSESVDIRLSLNSCKERMSALKNEEESIERLISELSGKEEFIQKELALTESRIKEREKEAEEKEHVLRELVKKAGDLATRISNQKEILSAESEELLKIEQGLKTLRNKIELSSQRLSELDVQRAEYKLRIQNLKDNIGNTYSVDLESLETEPVTPEEEEALPTIKKKLEALGTVSLGSIEEYEELKNRYDFLTKQREDLEKSIAELEEAIRRINSTTRKRLREAYDALNEKFSEVFTTLFGGGRAELVLTDESNILETGIDIVAQPPGKRLQNINLLSGGEKALTALALLFSSFLIKPTPLCILDEADAALDESNTEKFSQMLKDLSRDIQFVVVTHNRVTMEAADYIYGITMEEPGVSKVISLELTEAQEPVYEHPQAD